MMSCSKCIWPLNDVHGLLRNHPIPQTPIKSRILRLFILFSVLGRSKSQKPYRASTNGSFTFWPLHHYIKDCWLCKHITVVADIYSLNLFRNNGIISRYFLLFIHTELRHLYTTNYIIFKKDCLWKLWKKYGGDCFLHLTPLYIFHGFSFLKVRLPCIILTSTLSMVHLMIWYHSVKYL